jgi:hypothetical protein
VVPHVIALTYVENDNFLILRSECIQFYELLQQLFIEYRMLIPTAQHVRHLFAAHKSRHTISLQLGSAKCAPRGDAGIRKYPNGQDAFVTSISTFSSQTKGFKPCQKL